jgi:hypothetical protein
MVERLVYIFLGIAVGLAGMSMTASFGLLAFLGMPLMIVGLGLISAGANPAPGTRSTGTGG